ncbi:YggS family pyridoxal phosphate-dependent enzyme [Hydrogenibacillus schlegelii]|uniref:Pyridoxal phosphate homeostasis protein n=2 Tax=Hydrogenibacillus schlegelii TaxID=1484 RepID=A0A132N9P7_HYDSH|nr:YggS family pyridoxal phosphate-dependent enzyme [Hydrogenibacillus schlegelii]KWX06848.1 hypothetical protein TR75_04700 [Hydrogenibacillus schlegelii]OAR04312.1 hypothetical protein SA87_01145 [Hydrogenibacillus schlegelii]
MAVREEGFAGAAVAELRARIEAVRARIRQAAERSGRDPATVRLVLATKTVPATRLRAAALAGATAFGENRAQELRDKAPALSDLEVEWHFIGHLQTNKVKDVLPYIRLLHSLDRPTLAEALNRRLEREGRTLEVLLQVNTSGEESKFGVAPEAALPFYKEVVRLPALRVRGFMTIGAHTNDEAAVRESFRRLREIRDRALALGLGETPPVELSMGMSGDLELAVEEGATIVRVGSAIFGPRPPAG